MSIKNGRPVSPENRVVESFRQAYAEIHEAADFASKMAGDDGKAVEFLRSDVHKLMRMTQKASCHLLMMVGTFDGLPEPQEKH